MFFQGFVVDNVNCNFFIQVIVRDPPVFSPRPQLQYHGQVGEEVTLVCGGQGSPTPEVTWKRVCDISRLCMFSIKVYHLPIFYQSLSFALW